MRKPIDFLAEGDYSHFSRRYETDLADDPEMAKHLEWAYQTYGKTKSHNSRRVIDAKRLLAEQLQFLDSVNSLGLQLADMLAAILRRALNDRLQRPGWERFGRLVVYDPRPGWFIALGPRTMEPIFPPRVVEVWDTLNRFSKPMIPKGR